MESTEELKQKISQLTKEINQLKKTNFELEEKLAAALDGTGLVIWEQDVPSGRLKMFNQKFGSLCGYSIDELDATVESWKSRLHPDDKEEVLLSLENHLQGLSESYTAVHRMIHKDGSNTWVSDRGRVVEFGQSGEPLRMMGTHIDITQKKNYELSLARLANLDPLTGLLNRKAFKEHFNNYVTSSRYEGGALLFIDLDNFKLVNDLHGHKVGDECLLSVAKFLTDSFPESTKISRFGGDEFVVLYEVTDRELLTSFVQALLNDFNNRVCVDTPQVNVSLSIGVSIFQRKEENFEKICESADAAMYKVKKEGKNSFNFC